MVSPPKAEEFNPPGDGDKEDNGGLVVPSTQHLMCSHVDRLLFMHRICS